MRMVGQNPQGFVGRHLERAEMLADRASDVNICQQSGALLPGCSTRITGASSRLRRVEILQIFRNEGLLLVGQLGRGSLGLVAHRSTPIRSFAQACQPPERS